MFPAPYISIAVSPILWTSSNNFLRISDPLLCSDAGTLRDAGSLSMRGFCYPPILPLLWRLWSYHLRPNPRPEVFWRSASAPAANISQYRLRFLGDEFFKWRIFIFVRLDRLYRDYLPCWPGGYWLCENSGLYQKTSTRLS